MYDSPKSLQDIRIRARLKSSTLRFLSSSESSVLWACFSSASNLTCLRASCSSGYLPNIVVLFVSSYAPETDSPVGQTSEEVVPLKSQLKDFFPLSTPYCFGGSSLLTYYHVSYVAYRVSYANYTKNARRLILVTIATLGKFLAVWHFLLFLISHILCRFKCYRTTNK
jgi:hypothetical protein